MTAHPGESTVDRPDCGVCGVAADAMVEVTHDGAMVPRCAAHVEERPYQAEARLAALIERARAVSDELHRKFPRGGKALPGLSLFTVWSALDEVLVATDDECTCAVSEPDGFGNRDPIENPDCPTCGSGT